MKMIKRTKDEWLSEDNKYMIIRYSSRDWAVYEKDSDNTWQYQMTWSTLRDAKNSI